MITRSGPEGFTDLVTGVRLKTRVHGDRTHLTEVRLAAGAVVPEHTHQQEQTGYLVSGRLRFFGSEGETVAGPGDTWVFAGGVSHGAEALEDAVVIEVFSPVREDYLRLAREVEGRGSGAGA